MSISGGWFPRINAAGVVASGDVEIFVGDVSFGPGGHPHWRTERDLIFAADGGVALVNIDTRERQQVAEPCNELSASGTGYWAGWRPGDDRQGMAVFYHGTEKFAEAHGDAPACYAPSGGHLARLTPYQSNTRTLIVDNEPLASGPILSMSVCETAVVWRVAGGTFGRRWNGAAWGPEENWTVLEWEDPQVLDTPDGPWVLSGTQTGMILRPAGSDTGYLWGGGNDYFPHARWIPALGRIRLVSSTNHGVRQVKDVDLRAPRVKLTAPIDPPDDPVDPDEPDDPPKEPKVEATEHLDVVRSVIADHPEINTRSDDDSVRGVAVDYVARRLNHDTDKPWGRKARQADGGNKNGDGLTYLRSDGAFEIIDVLSGSDGSATWDHKGIFQQGQNGYWAPPGPGEGSMPPDDPADPPASDLPARVKALEAKLLAVSDELGATQQVVEETHGWVDTLERRIAKLESASGVDLSAYRVRIATTDDTTVPTVSTNRVFAHAHEVRLVGVLEKK